MMLGKSIVHGLLFPRVISVHFFIKSENSVMPVQQIISGDSQQNKCSSKFQKPRDPRLIWKDSIHKYPHLWDY